MILKTVFVSSLLDAVDPLVLLLRGGCRDAVHHVVSFHHSPVGLRFTRLDQLAAVVWDVQLKAVLFEKVRIKLSHHTLSRQINNT